MLPIYTTYLAYLSKFHYNPLRIFPTSIKSVLIYYVMRQRGNEEVAPSKNTLQLFKERENQDFQKAWTDYRSDYNVKLLSQNAQDWMRKRAEESKAGYHVVLVCFEKSPEHCHRRLLAEAIAAKFGADYKGELSQFQ